MRKKKVLLAVLSLVLSCAFIAGCAKSQFLSVGKTKYDAVLYASDNYAVAVEKGKTYVYKDGKKLNSTAFYEVDPVEIYVETPEPDYPGQTVSTPDPEYTNDAFLVTTERGAKPQLLSGITGELKTYEYEISDIKAYKVSGFMNSRIAGYIVSLEDDKKAAVSASSLNMSTRYDDMDFQDGFFRGVTFVESEDGSAILSFVAEKNGTFDTVFSASPDEDPEYDVVTDEMTGGSLLYYTADSAGGTYSYGIAGSSGEIDTLCSVPRSCGMGYFEYDKKGADDVIITYVVTPDLKTVSIGEGEVKGITYDGKVFVSEPNTENKERLKELNSGKTTEYYDAVMVDPESELIAAYSGNKTLFFDKDFGKIAEFDAQVADNVDIKADGDDLYILAECVNGNDEEILYAYVNGAVKSRALGDYTATLFDGVALLQKDGENKLWIPSTNAEITLSAETDEPVVEIGESMTGEALFYALVTGESKPWIVSAAKIRSLESTRNATNDIAAVMGISDTDYSTYDFSAGSVTAANIMNRTAYDCSLAGLTAFYKDNIMQVDYITYTSGSTVKTVLSYGSGYDFIGDKRIYSGGMSMTGATGSMFTARSELGGKASVYKVNKTADGVEVKAILEDVADHGNVSLKTDLFGEYVFAKINGKTAVYDSNGNLLLAPKYNALSISGGNVLVSSGEKYGLVKLGKNASKAKLAVKIEYDEIMLLPTGDYITFKFGSLPSVYNKDGKSIAKNVVVEQCETSGDYLAKCYVNGGEIRNALVFNYSDGTSKITDISIEQDKVNVNLFMFAIVGSLLG